MRKNVIKDQRTKKHYWDNGIIRNFEEVLLYNTTWKEAKVQFPECIKI